MVKIRKPYERERVSLSLSTEGGADQSHRDLVDINSVIARFRATGMLDHVSRRQPLYADVSDAADLHTQLNRVRLAEARFAALPARVRSVANNDPVQFLEMLADEHGTQLLVDAGLQIEPEGESVSSPSQPVSKAAAPPPETSTEPPNGGE